MGVVYLIRNTVNGKVYVGQTSLTPEQRWKKHVAVSTFFDFAICRAIRKYGSEAFTVEQLTVAETLDELNVLERHFVGEYKSSDSRYGYNMTLGGDGVKGNEESRKKQREAWKHRGSWSEETREKMAAAKRGKKHTAEHNERIRQSLLGNERCLGKNIPEEVRIKMSEAHKQRWAVRRTVGV